MTSSLEECMSEPKNIAQQIRTRDTFTYIHAPTGFFIITMEFLAHRA
jgi:hypothetical protein